ncbi:MAG: universal stress protein [Actinomycetaceae bacterium]|nr:universal stress protein [Actinomycetaceae bacterium]
MSILVGFTGTLGGQDALALGDVFARTLGTDIDVLIVLPSERRVTLAPPDESYEEMVREQALAWLDQAEDVVHTRGEIAHHIRYAETPTEGLLHAVEEFRPDCLVMGGGRHGAFGTVSLSPISTSLLHASTEPVALAPRGYRERHIKKISRVTAFIGRLPSSGRIIQESTNLARRAGVPLRLVSLLPLDNYENRVEEHIGTQAAQDHAQNALAMARERLPEDIETSTELALGHTIEDATQRLSWLPDEVAMLGSSRLAAPRRLFLGSVANSILRVMPVPLIIVPREERLEL